MLIFKEVFSKAGREPKLTSFPASQDSKFGIDRVSEFIESITSVPGAMLIIWLAGLGIFIAVAWYVVNWFRGLAYGEDSDTNLLTDFQQIKQKEWVTDEEYEKIRQSTPIPELPLKNGSSGLEELQSQHLSRSGSKATHESPIEGSEEEAPIFRESNE